MGFLSNLFRNKQEHQQHGRGLLEANRAFLKSAEQNKNILGQYQQRQAERAAQLAKRKAELSSKKSSPSTTASASAPSKTTTSHNSSAQVMAMLAKAPTPPTMQPTITAINQSAAATTTKPNIVESKKRKSPAISQKTSTAHTKVAKTNTYASANPYSSKTKMPQSGVSVSDIQKKGWSVATQGLTLDQKGALLPKLDAAVKRQKLTENAHQKFEAQFPAVPTTLPTHKR